MFRGIKIVSAILTVKQFIKEKRQKPLPPNTRFNHELYEAESYGKVSPDERSRRLANGYYHTTEAVKQFDLKKYREDVLAGLSPEQLRDNRLKGVYGAEKPIMNTANRNNCSLWTGYPSDLVCDVERYEYERERYPERFQYDIIPKNTYIRIWEEKIWKQ